MKSIMLAFVVLAVCAVALVARAYYATHWLDQVIPLLVLFSFWALIRSFRLSSEESDQGTESRKINDALHAPSGIVQKLVRSFTAWQEGAVARQNQRLAEDNNSMKSNVKKVARLARELLRLVQDLLPEDKREVKEKRIKGMKLEALVPAIHSALSTLRELPSPTEKSAVAPPDPVPAPGPNLETLRNVYAAFAALSQNGGTTDAALETDALLKGIIEHGRRLRRETRELRMQAEEKDRQLVEAAKTNTRLSTELAEAQSFKARASELDTALQSSTEQLEEARRSERELTTRCSDLTLGLREREQTIAALNEQLTQCQEDFKLENRIAIETQERLDRSSARVAELETALAAEKRRRPRFLVHQDRLREALCAPTAMFELLRELKQDPTGWTEAGWALLTMPEGAQLVSVLLDRYALDLDQLTESTPPEQCEEASEPILLLAQFVTDAIEALPITFLRNLEDSTRWWALSQASACGCGVLLGMTLFDEAWWKRLRDSSALYRALDRLPEGVRLALVESAPTPEEALIVLFGSHSVRSAGLKIGHLARLAPDDLRKHHGFAGEPHSAGELSDPLGLRFRRWIVDNPTPDTAQIFDRARDYLRVIYRLNASKWRELMRALLGDRSGAVSGLADDRLLELFGYDARDALLLLDPSAESCAEAGLDSSHLDHFVAVADLVEPDRGSKSDLDRYTELIERLTLTRGIDALRNQTRLFRSHGERFLNRANRVAR